MEKSILENLNDKIIFFFIKKIEEESEIDLDGNSLLSATEDVNNKMRLLKSVDYIDIDFIVAIYNLNKEKFSEKNLTQSLDRPVCENYKYDMYETRIETVNYEYTVTQSSYSEKNLKDIIDLTLSNGDMEYWEYPEVARDYVDSETTDNGFVAKSIRKIK